MTAMADYYSFVILLAGFVFLPMYIVGRWYSYYLEKQREQTLREAMRHGNCD